MTKISKLFSFTATAKRAEFLQVIAIVIGLWLLAAYIDETFVAPNLCHINEDWFCYLPGEVREGITFDMVVLAGLLILLLAVIVRRLNSHGKNPFFALLSLPLMCLLAIFLYFSEVEIALWHTIAAAVIGLPLLYWMLIGEAAKK